MLCIVGENEETIRDNAGVGGGGMEGSSPLNDQHAYYYVR